MYPASNQVIVDNSNSVQGDCSLSWTKICTIILWHSYLKQPARNWNAQVHFFRCTEYILFLLSFWFLVPAFGRYLWLHTPDSYENRQSSRYMNVLAWIFYKSPCSPEAGVPMSLLLFGIQLWLMQGGRRMTRHIGNYSCTCYSLCPA